MMSPETLARIRSMTLDEKMALTIQMMRENGRRFWSAPPEVIANRLEIIRKQNDDRNRRLLEAFARSRAMETETND
jgi:hypothetical protein